MGAASQLPSALEGFDQILDLAAGRRFALFLDYDGTLTPIVDRPDLAVLSEETRRILGDLARRIPVAVISGRSLEDVKRLVALAGIYYAGSHGFEIEAPSGKRLDAGLAEQYLAALDRAEAVLRGRLRHVPNVLVERKRYTIAVHYRLVDPRRLDEVRAAVSEAAAERPELRRTEGKKVFELQPALEWNKGKAVERLVGELGLRPEADFPLFIGDDRTDEDAFRAVAGWGAGILVREAEVETAAQFALNSAAEVGEFLRRLSGSLPQG